MPRFGFDGQQWKVGKEFSVSPHQFRRLLAYPSHFISVSNSNISKDNYAKLVSIPNNDNSTQVKDEEIYAAMNAMCEIFGETNTDEAVMLQSHIEQDVIPITTVPAYIHQDEMDETLNLTQADYSIAPPSEDVKVAPSSESEKHSEPSISRPSKRKKQKSLVSRADLDKFLREKKSKRKSSKSEQRKTKKLTDPTQCLICGKTFAYGYMESHVRTHSGYVNGMIWWTASSAVLWPNI